MATPAPMTVDQLSLMLRRVQHAAGLLKAMQGGLEEEAEARIRSGNNVPGFALEAGRGKTEWCKPLDEIAALGDMFGIDFRKAGCITPIQARDKLKKQGIDESVTSEYSKTVSGVLKLVTSDTGKLQQIFGK